MAQVLAACEYPLQSPIPNHTIQAEWYRYLSAFILSSPPVDAEAEDESYLSSHGIPMFGLLTSQVRLSIDLQDLLAAPMELRCISQIDNTQGTQCQTVGITMGVSPVCLSCH